MEIVENFWPNGSFMTHVQYIFTIMLFRFERQMSWKMDKVVKWQLQNIFANNFSKQPTHHSDWERERISHLVQRVSVEKSVKCSRWPSRNEQLVKRMAERKAFANMAHTRKLWQMVRKTAQTKPDLPNVGGLQFWWPSQNWSHQMPTVCITAKRQHSPRRFTRSKRIGRRCW